MNDNILPEPPSTPLATRQLGQTDLEITRVGFGAWAIGGEWYWGWGPQDDAVSVKAIRRALDLGINWIDTAPVYGLGHSEEVVGKVVSELQVPPLLFTKCGLTWNKENEIKNDLSPQSIRREVEESLRRLRVETIDLYQVHWPIPDESLDAAWETLAQLRDEKKIRYLGASNFSVDQLHRVQEIAPIATLQPPYSLVNRSVERELLPYCLEQGIGVIVYSPMFSGLLSGKMSKARVDAFSPGDWRRKSEEFQEPRLSKNLALADRICQVAQEVDRPAGQVSVAWTLKNPAVTAAIVGIRTAQQIEDLATAAEIELTESQIAHIENA